MEQRKSTISYIGIAVGSFALLLALIHFYAGRGGCRVTGRLRDWLPVPGLHAGRHPLCHSGRRGTCSAGIQLNILNDRLWTRVMTDSQLLG